MCNGRPSMSSFTILKSTPTPRLARLGKPPRPGVPASVAGLFCMVLGLSCGPAFAKGPGAHLHGVARLDVVLDDKILQLSLETPLANLLGFERGPRSEAERQAVRAMALRFHAGATLFVPTAAAGCTLLGSELASNVIEPSLLAAPAAVASKPTAAAATTKTTGTAPAAASVHEHADLDANLRFLCAQPAALKGVEVRLFQAFPRLRQLDTALATGRAQRGARLTPQQTMLSF